MKNRGIIVGLAISCVALFSSGIEANAVSPTKSITITQTSSVNSFSNFVSYNDGEYYGTLTKTGTSAVVSGTYTPEHTKWYDSTKWHNRPIWEVEDYSGVQESPFMSGHTEAEINALLGRLGSMGVSYRSSWTWIGSRGINPTEEYSDSEGYTGTLTVIPNMNTSRYIKGTDEYWEYPESYKGQKKEQVPAYWRTDKVQLSGYITKPASDTRVYGQQYTGTVTKIDSEKPVITASNYGWTNNNTITINASATDTGGSDLASLSIYNSVGTLLKTSTTGSLAYDYTTTEGSNKFTIKAVDGQSNIATKDIYVFVDKTKPSATGSVSSAWTKNDVTINYSISDNLSGINSIVLLNGATVVKIGTIDTIPTTGSLRHTITAEGKYSYTVYADDKSNNPGTKNITSVPISINIDKSGPTIGGSDSYGWSKGSITVNNSATDNLSGLASIVLLDSSNNTVSTGSNGSLSYSVTLAGTNTFTVKATDNVGNYSTKTITTKIDNTGPTISGSDTFGWSKGSVTVTQSATDNQSGMASIKLYNSSNTEIASGVDSLSTSITAEGTNTYKIVATDLVGNTSQKTITTKVDSTAPTVTFNPTGSSTWGNASKTVRISLSDTLSGLSSWKYRIKTNGVWGSYYSETGTYKDVPLSTSGNYQLEVIPLDTVGNTSTVTSLSYLIDLDDPSGSYSSYSSWSSGNIGVVFTPSDTGGSGVKSWRYMTSSDNGTTWSSWSSALTSASTITLTTESAYNIIKAEITDNAGNVGNITSGTYKIDKTNPGGSFSPNSATWFNSNKVVTFTPSDDRSGVSKWRYRVSSDNGANYATWSSYITGDTAGSITIDTNGSNTIQAEVTDKAGNIKVVQSGVYYRETTLPSGTLNPTSRDWGNTNVTVAFTPSDTGGSGVASWQYRKSTDGGGTWGSWSTASTVLTSTNIVVSDEGENNKIQVKITDGAGNVGYVDSGLYKIDKVKPSGTFTGGSTSSWNTSNITVVFDPSDDRSGVKSWRYRQSSNNGSSWTSWSTAVTGDTNGNISITTESQYNIIQVEVTDNAGNVNEFNSGTYKLDKTDGTGLFSPSSSTWFNNNLTVSFDPSDNLSGVKQWRYRESIDNGTNYGSWSSYVTGDTVSTILIDTNGSNKIQVEITDNAGNIGTVDSGVYYRETTLPSGTLVPSSKTWTDSDITAVFTPSDTGGSGVSSWRYRKSVDGGTTWGSWSTASTVLTSTNIVMSDESGNIKLQIEITDKAGNVGTVNSGVYQIDKTDPTGAFDITSKTWVNSNISVKFTPGDILSGVKSWRYALSTDNGSTWGSWTAATSTAAQVITISSESGYNKIKVEVTDNAGNAKEFTSGIYQLDKTKPSGVFSPNSTTSINNNWVTSNVTVRFTPSDSLSLVKSWKYRTSTDNGATWTSYTSVADGNYRDILISNESEFNIIEAEVTDNAGNVNTIRSGVYKLDKSDPTGSFNPNSKSWTNSNIAVTFTPGDSISGVKSWRYATSSDNGATWSSYTSASVTSAQVLTISTESQYNKIKAEVTDNAGRVKEFISGTYSLDKTKPSGTFNPSSKTWINSDITVRFTPSDDRSGVVSWKYRKSSDNGTTWGTYTTIPDGNYRDIVINTESAYNIIEVEVTDAAGNKNTIRSGVYQLDKTKPSGSYNIASKVWDTSNITVVFTPSDDRSNVKSWVYRTSSNNGSTWSAWSSAISGATAGNILISTEAQYNKIQAQVTDNAGNVQTIDSGTYGLDKTNPTMIFNPNSRGWGNTNIIVNMTPGDSLSGVSQWRYRQSNDDGANYGAWSSYVTGSTAQSTTISYNGTSKLQTEVTDIAGNVVILTSGSYKKEVTNPTITFSPNNTDWGNTDVVVSIDPNDLGGSGVASWVYRTTSDGVNWSAWSSAISGDTTSTVTISTESGNNQIQVKVTDNAGNSDTYTSGVYKIDKTLPSGYFDKSTIDWTNNNVTVRFVPSDDRSGVASWKYRTSSDNGVTWGGWSSDIIGDTSLGITLSTEARYNKIQVVVYDNAGNLNTLESDTYGIDKTKPSGTLSPSSSTWRNSNINVTFTPNDSLSGVKSWRYRQSSDGRATWGDWSNSFTTSSGVIVISVESALNVIQVEVTDNAGNIGIINSGNYQLDKTLPSSSFSSSYTGGWYNTNIDVTITPSDDRSGVKQWRYRLSTNNGSTFGSWSSTLTSASQTITLSTEGYNVIQVEVIDNAFNISTTKSSSYNIDKTKPTGSFTYTYDERTTILRLNSNNTTDNLSGISKVYVEYLDASSNFMLRRVDLAVSGITRFTNQSLYQLNSSVNVFRVNVYAIDNANNTQMLFTEDIDIFKVEADLTRVLTTVDGGTSYYGGDKAKLSIRLYGGVNSVSIDFPSEFISKNQIDKLNNELNKVISTFATSTTDNTVIRNSLPYVEVDYYFYVPTELAGGNYNIQISATKNRVVKRVYNSLTVLDSSNKDGLKTIIIFPGR